MFGTYYHFWLLLSIFLLQHLTLIVQISLCFSLNTNIFELFPRFCMSRNEYNIGSDIWCSLFAARFPCAAYARWCGGCCGFGSGSKSTCPSFSIQVILNVLQGDKGEEHEEASEQVQDAQYGCKVMSNFTLGKEHDESHADGLKAPRNAKDKEEFAVQDLKNSIGQK